MSETLNISIPKDSTLFLKKVYKKEQPVSREANRPSESRKRGEKVASGTGWAVRGNVLTSGYEQARSLRFGNLQAQHHSRPLRIDDDFLWSSPLIYCCAAYFEISSFEAYSPCGFGDD